MKWLLVTAGGLYVGHVKAKATITLRTNGIMRLANGPTRPGWKAEVARVLFTIVGAQAPGHLGLLRYGSSVAAADTSIQVAGESEVEGGDAHHDYLDVGIPLIGPVARKTFEVNLFQLYSDINRMYLVDEPVDLRVRVGVASVFTDNIGQW